MRRRLDDTRRARGRLALVRVLIAVTLSLGLYYLTWRWADSVNWALWWFAVPLVVAETYSFVDSVFFGVTMWRLKTRGEPPIPSPEATVDVLITTYNEPVELVRATVQAAKRLRHRHTTWVLDDGARREMQAMAAEEGVSYLTRGPQWDDRPRHAKAGNLNNALTATQGEFLLILDADQVPDPALLERTLGYFEDDRVALVQTPQWFSNVAEADPLGSQAPLFYGPIQQGKDGWNAAFFCGSNAVLRREALMQIGLAGYVGEIEASVRRILASARRVIRTARRKLPAGSDAAASALDRVEAALHDARQALESGVPVSEVTWRFQRSVDQAAQGIVAEDVDSMRADLAAVSELAMVGGSGEPAMDLEALERLSAPEWSPLGAIESVSALVGSMEVHRRSEAEAVMPMATISVTEDMATAMRLHRAGWKSVYHHEVLAHGLAPEDLSTMLQQRLRWAQGTLQVMLRENPLVQRGLSIGQRLMYFATMWSYLSGFAALVYVMAPMLYLFFGLRPVTTYGWAFVYHLLPYLVVNQVLFFVVGYRLKRWRGQQYSLALFPLWIRACISVLRNELTGRSLGFVVTSKTRQDTAGAWRLIWGQLAVITLLILSVAIGLLRLAIGLAPSAEGTVVNIFWAFYDLAALSVVVQAARYAGPDRQQEDA